MGEEQRSKSSILSRRNSIAAKLSLPTNPKPTHFFGLPNGVVSQSTSTLDLQLLSFKPSSSSSLASYTSLKDVLPQTSAVNSPTPNGGGGGGDISIRNRLVKQAASAYLSPAANLSPCTAPSFLRRLLLRLSAAACSVAGLLNRVFRSIWIP